jgi:aerobic-type carbon monoxide dehydrogenase small subunit (CoxS/CutS family)
LYSIPRAGRYSLCDNGRMPRVTELTVNGTRRRIDADPERTLLSVLRDGLDLTGTKYGCGEGQCGACTVLLDGQPVRSCITPVSAAAGKQTTTIEGIQDPLQDALLEADAMQCGYCTPGMIVSGVALLKKNPSPSREEIVRHMNGNICRCGTYLRIVAAIQKAAQSHA